MNDDLARATLSKLARRLVPLMGILYFISFLDRVNIGFAALMMNADLGFTPEIYGWGAGIFFLGYFLFEVPSNLALARFGARRWIARIMVSWGLVASAMALVEDPRGYYALRFLLGAAEAGFFPGMILYLTYWFPAAWMSRITAAFMVAVPISSVIGGPLSTALLELDGLLGLAGWQWLFIIEGLPAVVAGIVVLFTLPDGPANARWLRADERDWLVATLAAEGGARASAHPPIRLGQALANSRVLALGLVYFGFVIGLYGCGLWLPQIVRGFGLSTLEVGFVSAIPYLVAAIGMVWWGRRADRRGERAGAVAVAALVGAAGLGLSAFATDPVLAVAALSLAMLGIYAGLPPFWALPTAFLSGTAAAGGIALINALGNLGGFAGPYLVGWIKENTGRFELALLALAGFLVMAAVVALKLGENIKRRP